MSNHNEAQSTTANASLIGLTAFGGALVGFVLQLLVAFHFGASDQTDAYFMALSTSELMSKLLLGGSITAVFLPMFVERLSRGQRHDAWHLALNILHLTTALFFVLSILLLIFAEPFVRFIAPGFDPATTTLTVNLLRVLLPSFVLLFLVELTTAMLHSLKHFTVPALLRIISPTVSIITIITLVKSIGIFALAIGVVTGSVLQLALVFWALRKQGFSYQFILEPRHPAIKKLLLLIYPFIFSVLVTQGAGITYRILVSDLSGGSLASLKFAEKITQLLAVMFLTSVTMVIYPILSEKASHKDMAGMRDTISSAIRLISFVTIPVIVGVALLRQPLIAFIYQRGNFTADDAAMTSIALLFLVIGLTTNGISSVLGHATLALQETRAAVAVTIASQAIAIALFILLVPPLAHAGLALASSLVPLSIALLHFLYLTRFIPHLSTIFWHPTFLKIGILSALLAAAVLVTMPLAQNVTSITQLSLILQIILPTLAGSLIFFAGAHFWRIPEMQQFTAIITAKLKKYSQAS